MSRSFNWLSGCIISLKKYWGCSEWEWRVLSVVSWSTGGVLYFSQVSVGDLPLPLSSRFLSLDFITAKRHNPKPHGLIVRLIAEHSLASFSIKKVHSLWRRVEPALQEGSPTASRHRHWTPPRSYKNIQVQPLKTIPAHSPLIASLNYLGRSLQALHRFVIVLHSHSQSEIHHKLGNIAFNIP